MTVADVGLALQTGVDAPASAPTHRIRLVGGTISPTITVAPNPELRRGRLGASGYISTYGAAGSVEAWARPSWLGMALYASLGAKAVSGASDPWTHTITGPSDGDLPFLTVWRNYSTLLFDQFENVKIAGLVIASQAGRPLRATLDLFGLNVKSRNAIVGSGVAPESGSPFLHRHGQGALIVGTGNVITAIDDWTLTIRTGSGRHEGGSRPRWKDERASITLAVSRLVTAGSTWKQLYYGVASPADLQAPLFDVIALSGGFDFLLTLSTTRSLRLQVPAAELTAVDGYAISAREAPPRQTAVWRIVTPTSGVPVTATLRNGTASY